MKARSEAQRKAARDYHKRKEQEIIRVERQYADSGRWKTEGCLCGASPSRIHPKGDAYTELNFGATVRTQGYECLDCARTYELKQPLEANTHTNRRRGNK